MSLSSTTAACRLNVQKRMETNTVAVCGPNSKMGPLSSSSDCSELGASICGTTPSHSQCSVTVETKEMRTGKRVQFANWLHKTEQIELMNLQQRQLQTKMISSRKWRFHGRRSILFKPLSAQAELLRLLFDEGELGGLGKLPRREVSQFGRFTFLKELKEAKEELRRLAHRQNTIRVLLEKRYITKRVRLPSCTSWLTTILPSSPDSIFVAHVRMTRSSFGHIVSVLTNRCSNRFSTHSSNRQLPVSTQLYIALHGLGFYGNGANLEQTRVKFGYSTGTIVNCRRRIYDALNDLKDEYITWPDAEERQRLCEFVRAQHGYKSCFFLVDGTTHPLAFVPGYQRTSWYDRKKRYSMQALVTCDPHLRVIHLVVGWPGSTHDARVLRSADYMDPRNEREYFTGNEHGLGDAAFGLTRRAVPNYKEPLASIPENQRYNYLHASLRVRSEHCIGNVKGRFQGLREVRLNLNRLQDCYSIVKYITAGYVLHNMLLEMSDNWSRPYVEPVSSVVNVEEGEWEGAEEDGDGTAAAFREAVKCQVLRHDGYQL